MKKVKQPFPHFEHCFFINNIVHGQNKKYTKPLSLYITFFLQLPQWWLVTSDAQIGQRFFIKKIEYGQNRK